MGAASCSLCPDAVSAGLGLHSGRSWCHPPHLIRPRVTTLRRWADFAVFGYFSEEIGKAFFPSSSKSAEVRRAPSLSLPLRSPAAQYSF